jgi:hypothetical protein
MRQKSADFQIIAQAKAFDGLMRRHNVWICGAVTYANAA